MIRAQIARSSSKVGLQSICSKQKDSVGFFCRWSCVTQGWDAEEREPKPKLTAAAKVFGKHSMDSSHKSGLHARCRESSMTNQSNTRYGTWGTHAGEFERHEACGTVDVHAPHGGRGPRGPKRSTETKHARDGVDGKCSLSSTWCCFFYKVA